MTTRSSARLDNILDAAAKLSRNGQRTLFIGAHLPTFLATSDATMQNCFLDHRGRPASLIPHQTALATIAPSRLTVAE